MSVKGIYIEHDFILRAISAGAFKNYIEVAEFKRWMCIHNRSIKTAKPKDINDWLDWKEMVCELSSTIWGNLKT
jgi:hypothetical protein